MSEMNERVNNLINVKSFSITSCPINVLKEFKDFCVNETNDVYWVGLKILMERNKQSIPNEILFYKINELEDKLKLIESKPTQSNVVEKPKIKTFGMKEVKENVEVK